VFHNPSHRVFDFPTCKAIGVLSDSHIPYRIAELPKRVYELLDGCDLILHAGDLEDPAILKPLQCIAPTLAVRGNLHWQYSLGAHDQDLPLSITLKTARHTLWMSHGHFSFAYSIVDKITGYASHRSMQRVNDYLIARLIRLRPRDANVVVFGHSHLSTARMIDGVLYFNPGSIAAQERKYKEGPRMGRLTLDGENVKHEWFDLE
jgi:putative phosphoesterase